MAVGLYMDVHVPIAITQQLRRRGADVLTAFEDGASHRSDGELLERASELGRLMFTRDIRFKALAEQWQAEGRTFAGLVFAHQLRATIGQLVRDLELICRASDAEDWSNMIEQLPF
jgi:Domain of unknown function (DUF5615)